MGKNIVLLSDGTGNSAAKIFKTNVWRVYQALDLSNASQIAFYDDGVGTSSFKPLALLAGAFGWGLKRNIIAIYMFLCINYKRADQIFGFGFSRGAFTIRVLSKFILTKGLISNFESHRRIYGERRTHYIGIFMQSNHARSNAQASATVHHVTITGIYRTSGNRLSTAAYDVSRIPILRLSSVPEYCLFGFVGYG